VFLWLFLCFVDCFLFCLVLSRYCSATVLLEGFLACIRAPFGMNGVVSGAFSGSFRVVEGFSGSDA